jgi:effector-binding domain-containing protein
MSEGGSMRFKELEDALFAHIRRTIASRDELLPIIEELRARLGERVAGPPMAIIHWGGSIEGLDTEVGFPVNSPVEDGDIGTRLLDGGGAAVLTHRGPLEEVRDTYVAGFGPLRSRGLVLASPTREILIAMDPDSPEGIEIELQIPLHDWTGLLAMGIEEVLGPEARDQVMEGVEGLTPDMTIEDRFQWVKAALETLDEIANDEERYWTVSRCADFFPASRVEEMRLVYEENHDVDDVLEAFKADTAWYSTPYRKGNVIYHTKVPWDREGWESAITREERRRSYCHCALIRDRLDETPPTYCYCGTGWSRQLWEGILGKPVRVEILKSLPRGDDECQFKISLPK